jgi:transcriptional regulator with PAS, ATPase and Fis domain
LSALGDGPVEPEDISARISDEVNMLVGDESSFRDLTALVESVETREITKALRRSGGNKTKAAKVLGISRFALQRKMDKYELDSEEII